MLLPALPEPLFQGEKVNNFPEEFNRIYLGNIFKIANLGQLSLVIMNKHDQRSIGSTNHL